jgi:prefoldin subunit 5
VLNNVQLADSNIKQATMVIQQIQTAISTATTVMHGITNLRNLPGQLLSDTLAPYQSQVSDLQQLLGVVNSLKGSFTDVSDMIVWRANDAKFSGLSLATT